MASAHSTSSEIDGLRAGVEPFGALQDRAYERAEALDSGFRLKARVAPFAVIGLCANSVMATMNVISRSALNEAEFRRLEAFILLLDRITESSFYKNMEIMRFTMHVEHTRTTGGVHRKILFSHPTFRIEDFESLNLRVRPLLYHRDATGFLQKVMPAAEKLLAGHPRAAELAHIKRQFEANDLRAQVTSLVTAKSFNWSEPTTNKWQIIFGGHMWITDDLYDDLFQYGLLYHWNEQDDKWKRYREIETIAGSFQAVARCSIPFLVRKVSAAKKLQDLLLDTHLFQTVVKTVHSQQGCDPISDITIEAGEDLIADPPTGQLGAVVNPLRFIRESPVGSSIRENYSIPMSTAELKLELTLGGKDALVQT